MKSINVRITLTFDDMNKYGKDFHVALINEIMSKGANHLKPLNINIQEVKKLDVSYDMRSE
jgi:hypothetical protein